MAGYRLLRRLGRGAMAEVYLAEQCSLRRHVALKILRANLAVEQSYVKRFRLEAQAAASLVHPNIVQIYEVGCEGGSHFIAQEYVPGLNLREWLSRHGTPQLPLALGVMRQVAAALAKASEHGIVHRDIKPDNIMVSSSGEVKVADFGLARLSTGDTRLTQEGFTLGTPLYMSPEQVEGRPLDTRSDIYSFGVTCYHMLAGQPPFAGDTALAGGGATLAQPSRRRWPSCGPICRRRCARWFTKCSPRSRSSGSPPRTRWSACCGRSPRPAASTSTNMRTRRSLAARRR